MVVELAILTSSLALLGQGLAGLPARAATETLRADVAQARAQVTSAARASGVSVADAQRAYARAPYRPLALRFLYASGWIQGARHRGLCLLTRLTPRASEREATALLARDRRIVAALRRARITLPAAGRALARGLASACA